MIPIKEFIFLFVFFYLAFVVFFQMLSSGAAVWAIVRLAVVPEAFVTGIAQINMLCGHLDIVGARSSFCIFVKFHGAFIPVEYGRVNELDLMVGRVLFHIGLVAAVRAGDILVDVDVIRYYLKIRATRFLRAFSSDQPHRVCLELIRVIRRH